MRDGVRKAEQSKAKLQSYASNYCYLIGSSQKKYTLPKKYAPDTASTFRLAPVGGLYYISIYTRSTKLLHRSREREREKIKGKNLHISFSMKSSNFSFGETNI